MKVWLVLLLLLPLCTGKIFCTPSFASNFKHFYSTLSLSGISQCHGVVVLPEAVILLLFLTVSSKFASTIMLYISLSQTCSRLCS
uniref:Uncharacterized protein n=1 Tax=Anguilla anguilla TaxID=7936 RepID=A0A0E9S006_ANGAN